MVKVLCDTLAHKLRHAAKLDPENAADILLLAVKYMKAKEPLPIDIAEYLTEAIEKAMDVPIEKFPRVLADNLYLTTSHRRQKADCVEVGEAFDKLYRSSKCNTVEITGEKIGEQFGISDSLAIKHWYIWKKYK